jgi:hypothetical protein
MEDRLHYLCRLRLNGAVVFVVWYSGERHGFARDAAGRLRAACTPEALMTTAGMRDILLGSKEPTDYDFDRIRGWCAAPNGAGIDCVVFLNTWNFLDDLAGLSDGAETAYTRLSREAAACYDKLFWGSNLPAVTPPGERLYWFRVKRSFQADSLAISRLETHVLMQRNSLSYHQGEQLPETSSSAVEA